MKNITKLLFLFLFFTISIFSQDGKVNLKKTFETYIELSINQDFEKSFDYVVEDFFKIFPKSQMIILMKQMYNNPSVEFKLEKPEILNTSNIEKIENKFYSILTYSNLMKMKVKNQKKDENKDEKKMRISLIELSLNKKFGSDNVNYNSSTEFFEVKVIKKVCSVSKNGLNGWKFVTIDKEKKYLLEKFIPEQILDRI
jgi:hypothetical protein